MPGTNLTRNEARRRAELLSVDTYRVELDLTTSDATFGSETVVGFRCSEPGSSTFADLVDATVHGIWLNGVALDPAAAYADNRIVLTDLAAANELRVVADCRYSRTGEGLHRFVDPVDERIYLYTQFEVPDARRVFTTFEQPDLKATYEFAVTAPQHWEVVSNAATPAPEPLREGVAVWRFPPTARISTYITAIVAGEYHAVRDTFTGRGGEIPLGVFCRQSVVEHLDADEILQITRQGFGFFEDAFQMPYPFGKYDQLFVPEYNMGAMENAGAVTFRDDYLFRSRTTVAAYEGRANTILHEMAHMWFGDLVTMRWWDDLWLNESFAEWAAHHASTVATRYTQSWTSFCNSRKTWAYRQDQLASTHPIAADNVDLEAVEVNFDGITYAKGASALRQLVAWVGEDAFFAGLRAYFAQYAFGNTDLPDLMNALEATSGRELGSWTKEWLQTSGVNTLRAGFTVDADEVFTAFSVEQSAPSEHPTLRRHRIAVGLYDLTAEGLVRRERVELDVEGERTEVPALVGHKRPDLLLLNDGDLTYAKIRLDERSLATAVERADTVVDSLTRALVRGATWDMTRDAEMPATGFVRLVLAGVATETDLTAVAAMLRQAKAAIELYAAPAGRAGLRSEWERGLRELLDRADPGSDHQLALARALIASAHSHGSLDLIAGLLDGSRSFPGLSIDTDLRWRITSSLAAQGRIGDAEIDAELARDNTISGREDAAGARAAIPTPEAKERAWHAAVERDDTPNETQRSMAASFHQPGQDDILAPYLERYLATAATVWEERGVQRASSVLTYLFPRFAVSPQTLARIDDWLGSTSANPAARRLVSEGRDDMRRALAARECDAASAPGGNGR